jgi:diaminohydroxyphosphoribosylaminopyrimidine deaminase/5-amino-6-(5-phosphoribosylamino)uracil reductase
VIATPAFSSFDHHAMGAALALARRGLGSVWPNPAVGCVIARESRIVGRGWTQPGGRPHAETEALARAGEAARDATAYVTLEPCCHWGRTPPCADALIAAGIKRVVAAIEDPDLRVAGGGMERLRAVGIRTELGLRAVEAEEVNAGFFARVRLGRPLVTLKLASTLDGRIATASGESRWITGPVARDWTHLLRATHDAILVGTETALADDPELTCRLPGLGDRSPVRIILDRQRRLPPAARVLTAVDQVPTWLLTSVDGDDPWHRRAREAGVEVIAVEIDAQGRIDLAAALRRLGDRGLTRVLVEGGGRLAASLLRAALVDRLVWLHAPLLIGNDGLPAVAALGLDRLAAAPTFERLSTNALGADVVSILRRRD